MEKPTEPSPIDFGLPPKAEEQRLIFDINGRNVPLVMVGMSAIMVAALALHFRTTASFLLMVFFALQIFGVAMTFSAAIVGLFGWIEGRTRSALSPTFRNFGAYHAALADYRKKLREFEVWEQRRAEAFWRSLDGITFENELARLFASRGSKVEKTSYTGDGGVDLIVHDGATKTIVQCKAHNKKIAINTAREMAACLHDFKADRAIIACLEGVTKPVKDYIATKPITVLDVKGIVELQRQQQ